MKNIRRDRKNCGYYNSIVSNFFIVNLRPLRYQWMFS